MLVGATLLSYRALERCLQYAQRQLQGIAATSVLLYPWHPSGRPHDLDVAAAALALM